ncbi:MAG: DNA-methyltransferase [Thermodesulfobacteriota bacterium]
MNRIFLKSCEKMEEIKDGQVDLIITSPPYWNAIDYDVHTSDSTKWFRTRKGEEYWKYIEWLKRCFQECYRVLKPGKFCSVVIGTVLYNGRHYPLPHQFVLVMENIGYEFHQDIIWYKVTGGVKRAGVTIQNPYPGYYCPNIMTEYILIFRKPGPRIYQTRTKEEKEKNKIPIDDLFTKELANNIWHIAPVPPNQYDHPCPFPEEIPYRIIKFFSYPNDLVLDPFLGIGTTIKVANVLNRRWVGYEIKEKYIKIAERRLNEPLYLREQLISIFEKIPVDGNRENFFRRKKDKEYILESSHQKAFEFVLREKKCDYKTRTKRN